jgi:hypothetical protein
MMTFYINRAGDKLPKGQKKHRMRWCWSGGMGKVSGIRDFRYAR